MRLLSDEFNNFFLLQFNCEVCWSGLTKSVTLKLHLNNHLMKKIYMIQLKREE
jgi:hypothetical protein